MVIEFKYYYQHNGTDVWEQDPNRQYTIPAGGGTVPVDYFDRDAQYNPPTVDVTFQVDMAIQILEGKFNPAQGSVFVRGSFTNWSGGEALSDADGDSIYTGTVTLSASLVGQTIEFKYGYNQNGNEVLEGNPNRQYVVPQGGGTVPLDFFDRDSEYTLQFVNVTFQVNMAIQILEGKFNPSTDRVFVRGSFTNWTGGEEMSDSDGDSVYTKTIAFSNSLVGQTLEFKYGFTRGEQEILENDPVRQYVVPAGGGTIPVDFFDRDSQYDPPTAYVTFQVNMAVKILEAQFDPIRDRVFVRGDFTGWTGGEFLTDANGDSIYSATVSLTSHYIGRAVEFKYGYSHNGIEILEDDPKRRFTVPQYGGVVPLDYFNRDSRVDLPDQTVKTARITFMVDMSSYIAQGIFTSSDALLVRGSFNQWSGDQDRLSPSPDNSNIYVLDKTITARPDSVFQYKYYLKIQDFPAQEELGPSREFSFPGRDTTLAKVSPVFTDPRPIRNNLYRTFVLNAKPLLRRLATHGYVLDVQTGDTIRALQTLEIVGSKPPLGGWNWGSVTLQWRLWDDGTRGDKVAGDSLYTISLLFPQGTPVEFAYKYALNGRDAEAGPFNYRFIRLDENILDDTIFNVWGSQDTLFQEYTRQEDFVVSVDDRGGRLPVAFRLLPNYPNPFNPETRIDFEIGRADRVVLAVYNVLGEEIVRLVDRSLLPGRYSVKWNGRDRFGMEVPSGVYLYRLEADGFTRSRKMLLVR